MRPHLSVCTFTADPPERVARALAVLRDVADEIVVAVDDRVDPDTLGPVLDVADRVVRAEWVGPLEADLAWLQDLCSGEWTLRVDGDEVASPDLVDLLRDRHWGDDLTHAYVPRRWLCGGTTHALDEPPWWPDPQLRLIRNEPGLARYSPEAHVPPAVAGWHRFLEAPLYHLDLVLADLDQRAAKAARYERLRPGVRTDSGLSQNSGYYTPERVPGAHRTIEVAAPDGVLLRSVLDGEAVAPRPGHQRPRMEHVTRAQRTAPAPQPGDAVVEVVTPRPVRALAGASTTVTVRLTNCSGDRWSPADRPPVRLAARLRHVDGTPVGGEARADLPTAVDPGRSELVRIDLPVVPEPGSYRLEVGAVREGVAWFDRTTTVEVEVARPRRVLVSAGTSPFRHLGDDLIVRTVLGAIRSWLPHVEPILVADEPAIADRFGVRGVVSASALLHREGEATPAIALRRIAALRKDAERVAAGEDPVDPLHRPLLAALAEVDALVLAPGGGLATVHSAAQLWPKAAEAEAARALGVPVLIEGGQFGPFAGAFDHVLARRLAGSATRITTRDQDSARLARVLAALGGRRPATSVVPDPVTAYVTDAAALANQWLHDRGLDPAAPYAVLGLRGDVDHSPAIDALATAVDHLADHDITAVFLPQVPDDIPMAEKLGRTTDHPFVVADPMPDDDLAVALVRRAAITVGSRFHLAVLAMAGGVPAVGLVSSEYDRRKTGGLAATHPSHVRAIELPAEGAALRHAIEVALAAGPLDPVPAWSAEDFADALEGAAPALRSWR